MRGLKQVSLYQFDICHGRTRMGAWIETPSCQRRFCKRLVAPVWVRGLKQVDEEKYEKYLGVAPVWVRGLKQGWGEKI